ncbi:variant erythrocyte surface antigen beta subunit, putative [Babesia ovis]|uniref:Variant erythrocyte surface antigen beta subunit, putative n=1 Tax=Babesia ovis TaxID=5869 RepID=A0A9W5T9L0_BABOV|nr:variant erythrocyte surface antigen beta subunit, putative [Babesia ovis]
MTGDSVTIRDSLLNSPTNLKEAIDWILRLTGKDGTPNTHCLCLLSEVIHDLVRDVEGYLDEEELGVVRGTLVDLQGVEGTRRISELVEGVAKGLQKFVGWKEVTIASGGVKDGEIGKDGIGRCGMTGSSGQCTCGSKYKCGNGSNQKYTSSYDKSGNDCKWDDIYKKCTGSGTKDAVGDLTTLARILLGAVPLVFSGLSYLYWISKQSSNNLRLPLRYYVERMGYKWQEWRLVSSNGVDLGDQSGKKDGLIKVIKDCGVFGVEVSSGNYAQYLEKLRTEANGSGTTSTGLTSGQHSLLKLNILCSGYFRSLHTIDSIRSTAPRLPRTVREILTLVPKVQEMFRKVGTGAKGEVVFYGANVDGYEKVLTVIPGNVASYLLGAALVAPLVLLGIQDTIDCLVGSVQNGANDQPSSIESYKLAGYTTPVAIHDLYANMQFKFTYPLSETQSYYLLQDCLVALFYQLFFLKHVTYWEYTGGYGWGWCKYGEGVKCDDGVKGGTGCLSWICPVGDKSGKEYWDAVAKKNEVENELEDLKKKEKKKDKDQEKKKLEEEVKKKKKEMNEAYKKVINQENCGKDGASNPSPLQAFLTDCLKGFTCQEVVKREGSLKKLQELRKSNGKDNSVYSDCYPPFLSHRGHTKVFGTECAVPMGFSGSFREKEESTGSQAAAGPGNGMIGLGIYAVLAYYANDDVYSSGLYQITRCICSLTRRVPRSTGTLFGFFHGLGHVLFHRKKKNARGQDELDETFKKALKDEMERCPGSSNSKELLDAINKWRGGSHTDNKCLTLDSIQNCNGGGQKGQTCGKYLQPLTGSLYNSMATQFTETLHEGLKSLLDEFVKIDCSKSGCSKSSGGGGGSSHCCQGGDNHGTQCKCDNVVECVGVHGLFYRFGFTYRGPDYLSHNGTYGDYKRTCTQFNTQLQKVLENQLFKTVLDQLRKFIYTTRLPFGLYVTAFWLIVLVYLLWSMTVNLDLIHIQSHWRSPGSYLVPLQRILADGSRKGFCTLGYFQENNGDRLLSQGVKDYSEQANAVRSTGIQAAAGNKEVQLPQQLEKQYYQQPANAVRSPNLMLPQAVDLVKDYLEHANAVRSTNTS